MSACSFCSNVSLHPKKNEIPKYRLHKFNFNDPEWLDIWYKCKDRHPPKVAHICSEHFERHLISATKFLMNDPRNEAYSGPIRVVPTKKLSFVHKSQRKLLRQHRQKPFDPNKRKSTVTANLTQEQLENWKKELGIKTVARPVTSQKVASYKPVIVEEKLVAPPQASPVKYQPSEVDEDFVNFIITECDTDDEGEESETVEVESEPISQNLSLTEPSVPVFDETMTEVVLGDENMRHSDTDGDEDTDDEEDEDDGADCVATSSAKNVLIENCRSLFLDSVDFCETSLDFISVFYNAETVKLANCKFSSIMTLRSILCCCRNLHSLKIIHPVLISLDTGVGNFTRPQKRRQKPIVEDWIDNFELALSDGKSWEVIKVFEMLKIKIRTLKITLDYVSEDNSQVVPIEPFVAYIGERYAESLKVLRITNDFNPFTNQSQSQSTIGLLMNIPDLRLRKFSGSSFGNDQLFETFISRQDSLRSFSLSESIITESEMTDIGRFLTRLTHLDLMINTRNFTNKNVDSLLKNLQNLRSLKLMMAEAYQIQMQLPRSLREVEIKCSLGDPRLLLLPALEPLSRMERLSLSRLSLENESFVEIFKNMTNLKFLRLFPIEKMTPEHLTGEVEGLRNVSHSLKSLTNLESLCLCDDVVNDSVLFELQSGALNHLHLKNGFYKKELTISEQGLFHLATMCPCLIAIRHHRLNVYKRCIETGLFLKDPNANSVESCWRPGKNTDDCDDFG